MPPPAVPRIRTAARASQPPRERLYLTDDDADPPLPRKSDTGRTGPAGCTGPQTVPVPPGSDLRVCGLRPSPVAETVTVLAAASPVH
ncbi:hypothetical protein P7K49_025074 [Saguinus oedipus]|uniref:Uncharacterized protein n=1 Tax=Saguinus oedipus TaxID=9490 RepID=A0ABQ9UGY1_SAGOE|nr:hypothetical protein P7K49_025074 [Saguinus oedipus]